VDISAPPKNGIVADDQIRDVGAPVIGIGREYRQCRPRHGIVDLERDGGELVVDGIGRVAGIHVPGVVRFGIQPAAIGTGAGVRAAIEYEGGRAGEWARGRHGGGQVTGLMRIIHQELNGQYLRGQVQALETHGTDVRGIAIIGEVAVTILALRGDAKRQLVIDRNVLCRIDVDEIIVARLQIDTGSLLPMMGLLLMTLTAPPSASRP
jgi:hypothetical protein